MVDAILNLPPIAVVLSLDAGRMPAALGDARLVDAADRLGAGVLVGDHLLAAISQLAFIPNDGFQKPLQRSRGHSLLQGNCLGVLPLDIRQQASHVDLQ